MSAQKPLQCPWCGGEPAEEQWGAIGGRIACSNRACHVRPDAIAQSEPLAIALWNRRVRTPLETEALALLAAALAIPTRDPCARELLSRQVEDLLARAKEQAP